MPSGISEAEYPRLVEFMDKFLYQLAAPSFAEAIAVYHAAGATAVEELVREIRQLLSAGHSKTELERFVGKHSDYMLDTARNTLVYFTDVLDAKPKSE